MGHNFFLKILYSFRNNFYPDQKIHHLDDKILIKRISVKAETHFRTTSINLLDHLIDDGAVKCMRSILNDIE